MGHPYMGRPYVGLMVYMSTYLPTCVQRPQKTMSTLTSLFEECMMSTDLQLMKDKVSSLHTKYQSEVTLIFVKGGSLTVS